MTDEGDDALRVLEMAGLGLWDRRIYLFVLDAGHVDARTVAAGLGLAESVARDTLIGLRERGYVAHHVGVEEVFSAVDPRPILAAAAAELVAQAHAVRGAGSALFDRSRRAGAGSASGSTADPQVTASPATVAGWYAAIQHQAAREVRVFDRPPYISRPMPGLEERSISKGVTHRAVYTPQSFDREGAWEELGRAQQAGERGRIVSSLPIKMAVADDAIAVVCLSVQPGVHDTMLTTSPALIAALTDVFELYWERGVALPREGSPHPDAGLAATGARHRALTVQEQATIALIAGGATDEQIAERLGMSVRSVRRRTSALMNEVGADGRFQFGVLASRRGWV